MINVEGLTIAFHGNTLIQKALFALQKRERCGFVGRNGSGKTTFFRLLTGEETPDAGTIAIQKDYTIGILSQHIHFTQPTLIEEAALGLRPEDKDHVYKVEKILFGLGFTEEDLYECPRKFSGGYQLRLHLAKVLVAEPDCLLLDEPTNYLDIVSIRWFTRFLQQWKGEFILISHDREFMDSVTTHTIGIHRQQLRKMKGSSVEFFEKILQEEEIHERTAQNLEKKRAHLQSFVDRFGAKATKAAQAESKRKMIQRIPVLERLKEIYRLDFHFNEAAFNAKKMLEAINVNFAYDSANGPLVEDFSLSIEKGERIAIIGKNGRGKSTLLKLLSKELIPLHGTVKHSENLSIGYFGQTNIERLHPQNSVEDEVAAANRTLNRTEVKAICGMMMFSGDMAGKPTSMLSGGEKSRVLLGKILATPCNLLLLDEPTHHLDMESIEALIDALEDFSGAVIIVTHSELILNRLELNKIVVCREGKQDLFLGNYEEFLAKGGWEDSSGGETGTKSGKKGKGQRDERQQKAELIAERAKAIKPLDISIEKAEKEIGLLEQELHRFHIDLVDISQKGLGQEIQELSKSIADRQNKVDRLYEQLDELTSKRAAIEAKYAEKA